MLISRLQVETQAAMPRTQAVQVQNSLLQRNCSWGRSIVTDGECAACGQKRRKRERQGMLQRRAITAQAPEVAPPIVHEVLRAPGRPLDAETRAFMEPRFGRDFSQVRVHTNATAIASAKAVNALAYTAGNDIAFQRGMYRPGTEAGRQLLAHELAHTVQQNAARGSLPRTVAAPDGPLEVKATQAAAQVVTTATEPTSINPSRNLAGQIQRQFITPLEPGGSYGGLMERDRQRQRTLSSTPYHVCARPLQISPYGNHAYIEAPPNRYAIISPTCPGKITDNPIWGTGGQKWDNSPDPCGKSPSCVPCQPKAGITDVGQCLRDAFNSYPNPSFYRVLGPNSNTFAGTLARACCAGMIPQPSALGWVPGWDDSRPGRYGGDDCPPGPTC